MHNGRHRADALQCNLPGAAPLHVPGIFARNPLLRQLRAAEFGVIRSLGCQGPDFSQNLVHVREAFCPRWAAVAQVETPPLDVSSLVGL